MACGGLSLCPAAVAVVGSAGSSLCDSPYRFVPRRLGTASRRKSRGGFEPRRWCSAIRIDGVCPASTWPRCECFDAVLRRNIHQGRSCRLGGGRHGNDAVLVRSARSAEHLRPRLVRCVSGTIPSRSAARAGADASAPAPAGCCRVAVRNPRHRPSDLIRSSCP